MATTNSTLDEPYWTPVERGFFSATLLVIMIVAIVGNTLVMVIIILNRGMRTRTNLLLFNLALTDLATCIFDMPFSLVTLITGRWVFDNNALCMFMGFTSPLFVITSIHTLMYIAIHKCVTVRHPHSQVLTKRRIMVMNAAAWTWAVIASALSISGLTYVNHDPYTTQCSPKNPDSPASYAHLVLAIITCYAVPVVIIAVCSFGVWWAIRSYGRRMRESSTVDADQLYAQQRHITVTLFLVVAVFIVSWTPVVCYAIYSTVVHNEGKVDRLANPITFLFGFADSAVNPIIYAFRSESFREGYKQLMCFRKNKSRRPSTSSVTTGFHRGQTAVNRSSTASTTIVSRNASSAAGTSGTSTVSGRAPTAADYKAALNSSYGIEKDATVTTFLNDDDSIFPQSADGIEMTLLNRNSASGASAVSGDRVSGTVVNNSGRHGSTGRQARNDHQLQMVSFSEAEELEEHQERVAEGGENAVRSRPGLKTFLSVEHLDAIGDGHRNHHHNHQEGGTGSNRRKRRRIRGSLGGLHRGRDSLDAENDAEVAALSSSHQNSEQRHASPAVQLGDSSTGRLVAPRTAANDDSNERQGHRPIYKNSSDEQAAPGPRAAVRPTALNPPAVRAATPSSVNSYASERPSLPILTPDGPPLSRRVATSDWVAQQVKSVSPSSDVVAPRLQPQQPRPAESRRPAVDEVLGDANSRRRSKSRGATSASSSRNGPDNDVSIDAAEVRTGQPRTRTPRTSGRSVPTSALLDNSRSTEI